MIMIEEMKKQMHFIVLFVLVAVLSGLKAHGETGPTEIHKRMETAIQIEQKAQKKGDTWAKEKENILAEIHDLKDRQKWLDFQRKRYKAYIEKEKGVLQGLKRKKKEFEKIQMDLEPYLDEVLGRLETFVKSDLQFLREERAKRIAFLKDSLNDYRVGLSEKLRRVLEALQVEAKYGRDIEKKEGVLRINGETIEANLLRVGRLALFYETLDHGKVGVLYRDSGNWKTLPHEYEREINRAMEMAQRKRAIELLDLPVGSWKDVK